MSKRTGHDFMVDKKIADVLGGDTIVSWCHLEQCVPRDVSKHIEKLHKVFKEAEVDYVIVAIRTNNHPGSPFGDEVLCDRSLSWWKFQLRAHFKINNVLSKKFMEGTNWHGILVLERK